MINVEFHDLAANGIWFERLPQASLSGLLESDAIKSANYPPISIAHWNTLKQVYLFFWMALLLQAIVKTFQVQVLKTMSNYAHVSPSPSLCHQSFDGSPNWELGLNWPIVWITRARSTFVMQLKSMSIFISLLVCRTVWVGQSIITKYDTRERKKKKEITLRI